jgi:hypothetical protein
MYPSQVRSPAQNVNLPTDGSINLHELNFEAQDRIRWNDGWEATCSVSVVGRYCKDRFLAEGELGNTFVPSFDDFADTDLCNERVIPISTGIKLLSVVKSPDIVNRDIIAAFGEIHAIAMFNSFDGDAHDEDATVGD